MATAGSAPIYMVPRREIVAVEHPMAIKNIDNGLKTFGRGSPLTQVRRSTHTMGLINRPTGNLESSRSISCGPVLLRFHQFELLIIL